MSEIAVLGAGPSGLFAALLAAEAGHEVTVFEAGWRVGGMAGSFDLDGVRVDFGSHRLHPSIDPMLLARLQALLGDDLQQRERNGRILLAGRYVGFPLRAVDMVRSLPPWLAVRIAIDTLATPLRRREPTSSFADEVERRLGPTIGAEFYRPYAKKLYGLPAEHLDVELARRRVGASSSGQILARVAKAARPQGRVFFYPRCGYGQIAERIAAAVSDADAEIALNSPVTAVSVTDDAVQVTTPSVARSFDLVLSTIPVATLAQVLEPGPRPEVTSALAEVRHRSIVLIYLTLNRRQFTQYDAHYFPGSDVRIARLSEPKNYRDGDDPDGVTVLCAELACWPTDEWYRADDQDLADLVVEDLGRAGLGRVEPVSVHVERLPNVYPVYEPSTQQARATAAEWSAGLARILSFGRQGLAVPDNLHHVLAMSEASVGSIAVDGSTDRHRWHHHLHGFARNVVED